MGQSITSVVDMVSMAGELRRAAKLAPQPELAAKIQRSATEMEKTALSRVSENAPGIGALLDTFV